MTEAIVNKYFGAIYDFINDEIGEQLSPKTIEELIEVIERAENRLTLEIELREFVCEKFAKVVHSGQ